MALPCRSQRTGMPNRRQTGVPISGIEPRPELVGSRRCSHCTTGTSKFKLCAGEIDQQIRVVGRAVRMELVEQQVGSLERRERLGTAPGGELCATERRERDGTLAGRSQFHEAIFPRN